MFFEHVFKELDKAKLKYLVVGGVAVNLHGFARATADLDIVIDLDPDNVNRFIEVVKNLGWKPRVPVPIEAFADPKNREKWLTEKGMKAFTVYNPKSQFEHLDVLFDFPLNFSDIYTHKDLIPAGDLTIPVVSIKDLITLKEKANRGRDQLDVKALKQIQELDNEEKGR